VKGGSRPGHTRKNLSLWDTWRGERGGGVSVRIFLFLFCNDTFDTIWDKDEVNKREVCECEGWVWDLDAIGAPSRLRLIRKAAAGDAFPGITLIGSGFYTYLKGNPWPTVLRRQNRWLQGSPCLSEWSQEALKSFVCYVCRVVISRMYIMDNLTSSSVRRRKLSIISRLSLHTHRTLPMVGELVFFPLSYLRE
jgi:hypothetical protein